MRFLVLFLAIAALAAAVNSERVVRYHRTGAPAGYAHTRRADGQATCYFSLALPQRNVDQLEATLYRIADPKSEDYGKWLSKQEVFDIIGTPKATVNRVVAWLKSEQGIKSLDFTGDSFMVSSTCEYVEKLFHTKVHEFYSAERQLTLNRHLGPLSVPMDLDEHIVMISGITDFSPKPLTTRRRPHSDAPAFSPYNTPPSMRRLYNMTHEDVASPKVSQAPFADNAGEDGFGAQALGSFQQQCGIADNPMNRSLGSGTYTPGYDDGEANLDMEMITTFGVGAQTDFFIVDGDKGWMYEYTQEFMSTQNPPLVNSMSYAWNEDQQCANNSVPFVGKCQQLGIPNSKVYVNRTNIEFMKLASMGYTFLAASGDGGVDGNHGGDSCSYTHPLFPASSPFVVSVGATVTQPNGNPLNGTFTEPICSGQSPMSCDCPAASYEVVCEDGNYGGFDTGGGFSYFAKRPSYQAQAVENYLNSGVQLPPAGTYTVQGRGYPDVAALGGNIAVITGGSLGLTGGTSASTPIVAGMMSVLNDMCLKIGKSQVGFVTPTLYQAAVDCPECFNDITSGYNGNNCQTQIGFHAATGWDPTTGLGSINFGNMKHYIVNRLP